MYRWKLDQRKSWIRITADNVEIHNERYGDKKIGNKNGTEIYKIEDTLWW